jgi:integrating conjugative element protein (TIGR03758 family)
MTLSNNTLTAFQTASGIAPENMSIAIRTILLVICFLWSAWCLFGLYQHMREHGVVIDNLIWKIFRIAILIVLTMSLICV